VMVFPHGVFSLEALDALHACGYLAAVNTTVCPAHDPATLALRDLMEVAVTRFADFPVFGRHYPGDPAEFAFDLFLGKPALAVGHHTYFKDGYEPLVALGESLGAMEPRLQWASLSTICETTSLSRVDENGWVRVRFYTRRFSLRNHDCEPHTYHLSRRTVLLDRPCVYVDGERHACEHANGELTFSLLLKPGETVRIALDGEAASDRPVHYRRRVMNPVRRLLCEARDNHVETSPFLFGLVSSLWRLGERSGRAALPMPVHAPGAAARSGVSRCARCPASRQDGANANALCE